MTSPIWLDEHGQRVPEVRQGRARPPTPLRTPPHERLEGQGDTAAVDRACLALRMPATSSWRNCGGRSASGWDRTTRRSWEGISMSNESLLVILLIGLIAGWLAGHFVRGTGYGLIADIAIGIVGALIGSWLLPRLGIHLGAGIVPAIIAATIGAVVLLIILRFAYRKGRW